MHCTHVTSLTLATNLSPFDPTSSGCVLTSPTLTRNDLIVPPPSKHFRPIASNFILSYTPTNYAYDMVV
ncbi:hypothetical protein GW17_00049027 [Ensete ventricosum]|nr:hypothetical protein GW17_00049027 [Ensete ventricosum]